MSNIICYGEALIDFTQDGQGFVPHPGGSPYNVAIALGRLETDVGFCTQLSDDLFGKQLLNYLKNNNVSTENIVVSSSPSTLAFVSTPANAEPEYAFYSNGTADVLIDKKSNIPNSDADIHHFGSISIMQEPCGTFWSNFIMEKKGFISFDPNIRPTLIPDREAYFRRFYEIVSRTSLLRLSLVDLAWLAPDMSKEDFARKMLSSGVKIVALTAGNDGAWVYTEEFSLHQSSLNINVEDTIGAGDTFTAGFLSVLAENSLRSVEKNKSLLLKALKTGCIAAALNCMNKGANPPRKNVVEEQLAV